MQLSYIFFTLWSSFVDLVNLKIYLFKIFHLREVIWRVMIQETVDLILYSFSRYLSKPDSKIIHHNRVKTSALE